MAGLFLWVSHSCSYQLVIKSKEPMRLPLRSIAVTATASFALLGLSACGSDEADSTPTETVTTVEATPTPEETEDLAEETVSAEETEASDDVDADASPASSDQPEWANPVTTPGEKISSFTVGDLNVDVYQVGVEKAPKDGMFVNPKNNKPIIAEGDEIVFVNYVVTNTGAPIDLGASFVTVDARYDSWPYLGAMVGITDESMYEKQGINSEVLKAGALKAPYVYTLDEGQTFSSGTNFQYENGEGIVFNTTVTPVDAEGELVHDKRVEGEGKGKIS